MSNGQETCEVCGEPGLARVCGCDGVDLICHLGACHALCAKCTMRAQAKAATDAADKPEPRDVVEPCILEVQTGCRGRAADEAAALRFYKLLGIDKHSRKSFAADVLIGSFENVRLASEAPLGNDKLDNFRHLTHCWTCWTPRPRCADQWCVHPRELWKLREAAPDVLDIGEIADQIGAIEKARTSLMAVVPEAAAAIVARRLNNMIKIAQSAARGRAA
jgi:hypothetical protein